MIQRKSDEAVSPVVGVILMVAVTVVLAAVTYVWVSSFGTGGAAPGSFSASQSGTSSESNATFVVTSANGVTWSDLDFTLDGSRLTRANLALGSPSARYCVLTSGACDATRSDSIKAGDAFKVQPASTESVLAAIDREGNAILATIEVR